MSLERHSKQEINASEALSTKKSLTKVGSVRAVAVVKPNLPELESVLRFTCMIRKHLHSIINGPIILKSATSFESEDPTARPLFWVSTWVDCSAKYGFGYQLCDGSTSVWFNDNTKLAMFANKTKLLYTDKFGAESSHEMNYNNSNEMTQKKLRLLEYYRSYMIKNLARARTGAENPPHEPNSILRIPQISFWAKFNDGIIMCLNNGTVQINFKNHHKLIICPILESITFMTPDNEMHSYRFSVIKNSGCKPKLYKELNNALLAINLMIKYIETKKKK